MNLLENCLLLLGVPVAMILTGSWLGARLNAASSAERLAVAALAGLCVLLWNVSLVGFFRPISGIWAWLCLWPIGLGFLDPKARTTLGSDLVNVTLNRRGALALVSSALFFAALLWPLFRHPHLVFYDGTSNHDAFFWISGAEQLKRHTYMEDVSKSATQPFFNGVGVLVGIRPMWGRIGGEGLLALLSSIIGLSPLKLYVAATAALFIPWVAATFLVARTFLIGRLTTPALLALVALQPLFVFFHGNANLPNLLGVLTGGLIVVATARSLRGGPDRWAWLALLAFGFHGLLCSYPELAPFILLPGGLLWLRAGFVRTAEPAWRRLGPTFLAYFIGLAINPVSGIRAWFGFIASFRAARADDIWANIFQSIPLADYLPGLLTMNLQTAADFGPLAGLWTVLLLIVLVAVFYRAHDRFGALAMMSGAALLLSYTLVTDFNYGWQKTAQFAGIFTAALLPVAAIDLFSRTATTQRFRFFSRVALAGIVAFSIYATARNSYLIDKWSARKAITTDWFALRDYARQHLAGKPVLVDAASFRMAFFHGMWAIYFLTESHPVFTDRGHQNGGYLRDYVRMESSLPHPPETILVSADWASTWDANSPRLFESESIALLARANRVSEMSGFYPENGVPESAAGSVSVTVRPHSDSRLTVELGARGSAAAKISQHWRVHATTPDGAEYQAELAGTPPWRFSVPLVAHRDNRIEFTSDFPSTPELPFPFVVRHVRIENAP